MTASERTRAYVARLDQARATLAAEVEPDVAPVRHLSQQFRQLCLRFRHTYGSHNDHLH